MAKTPRGLGKGLGALLGETANVDQLRKPVGYINKEIVGSTAKQDTSDVLRIPVDMIEPNPFQPRMNFDQEALEELASSIRTLGLIQPITVRKISDTQYQIISGERRFRACRLTGMNMIPAYVRDANERGMLEMAIVENIQREELDPIEVALSYQRLIDECSLTQEEMAQRLGKKRATVANQLRLLKLPDRIQHDLKVGLVSVGHAKVMLGIDDPEIQQKLCDLVVKQGISVRELEDKVARLGKETRKPESSSSSQQKLPEEYSRLKDQMGRFFSQAVTLKRNAYGRGSITIKFNSDEEVRALTEILEKAEI